MSDLQLALLALAAVVLVGLYGYGKWQERQALKRMDASLRGDVGDALLESQTATAPAVRAPAQRIEPRLSLPGETPAAEAPAPLALAGVASHWAEDPLLDCVLELRCAHAVDGVSVFDAGVPLSRLALPLPVFLVAWDARAQRWVQPDRFGFYTELLVAVQMASRRHALDDIAVSRFIAAVQQVALALDADFDAPEADGIVARARELDRLCAQFDVQIGLTLEAQRGRADRAGQDGRCALAAGRRGRWRRRAAVRDALRGAACALGCARARRPAGTTRGAAAAGSLRRR